MFGEADLLFTEKCLQNGLWGPLLLLFNLIPASNLLKDQTYEELSSYEHGVVPLPVLFTLEALTMPVTRYSKQDQADHGKSRWSNLRDASPKINGGQTREEAKAVGKG